MQCTGPHPGQIPPIQVHVIIISIPYTVCIMNIIMQETFEEAECMYGLLMVCTYNIALSPIHRACIAWICSQHQGITYILKQWQLNP